MMNIEVTRGYNDISVLIDGVLHIHFLRSEYAGLQSWVTNECKKFCVEIVLRGGATILIEYDSREKFEQVLLKLGRALNALPKSQDG